MKPGPKPAPENSNRVPHQAAHIISRHMKDLLSRPVEVVRANLADPNSSLDYRQRKASRQIAARAIAARAIISALDKGSQGHLETILERTEGKVPNPDASGGGTLIQFNFSLAPGQLVPGSVGEILQGVIASQSQQTSTTAQPLALNPSNPTASSEQHLPHVVVDPDTNHNS